jgi:serine/threonine protein kinase HipA of HipAB toxin-antitoxin module
MAAAHVEEPGSLAVCSEAGARRRSRRATPDRRLAALTATAARARRAAFSNTTPGRHAPHMGSALGAGEGAAGGAATVGR